MVDGAERETLKLGVLIKRYFRKRRSCQKHANRRGENKKINAMVNFKEERSVVGRKERMRAEKKMLRSEQGRFQS